MMTSRSAMLRAMKTKSNALFTSVVFLHMAMAAGLCFTDGIPESQRVNLTNGDGESYPVGIWTPTWAAGAATSAVMKVLVNEKLGFLTVSGEGSGTPPGYYAIAGCETPNDPADPRCGRKKTYYHIHLEGWTEGYALIWKQIQEDYPDTAPVIVGGMGYKGHAGQYISQEVIETAYAQEGLTLEFYRSHNASWTNPSRYFDNISAINTENIKFCNETRLTDSKVMEQYVRYTGDWDGVDNSSGTVVGRCFQGHYWFAPVCRANPMTCYPFITAGSGWAYEHYMQKSAVWNIPLVIMVAKLWSDYTTLPIEVKSSFYWWEPDATFLSLDAHQLIYPNYDASAYRAGILTSAAELTPIDKYASTDLKALAPEVYEVLDSFTMDLRVSWRR